MIWLNIHTKDKEAAGDELAVPVYATPRPLRDGVGSCRAGSERESGGFITTTGVLKVRVCARGDGRHLMGLRNAREGGRGVVVLPAVNLEVNLRKLA